MTTTTSHTYPIVGAFYRPPAKALLNAIPIGTPLTLIAEPDNPHDPNAIAVWLDSGAIPSDNYSALEINLADYGFDVTTVLASESWHVGYIPRDFAALLRAENIVKAEEPLGVFFTLGISGEPKVRLNGG